MKHQQLCDSLKTADCQLKSLRLRLRLSENRTPQTENLASFRLSLPSAIQLPLQSQNLQPPETDAPIPTYTPKPLDTSNVELPESLNVLLEQLAENTHEVWTAQRIKDGWS